MTVPRPDRPQDRRRDRDSGFALIESIAVLALAALVLLTLLIAASLVTRNSGAAARRTNQIEELATGISAVRRDIAGTVNARTNATAPESVIFFGTAGALGIAVGSAASDESAGGSLIMMQASYDNQGGSLVRTAGRLLPGASGFAHARLGNPVNLLSGPWTYRFAYAATGPTGLQWRDNWPAESLRLPSAIRLEILHARQNQRVVPSLIVPIHVNAELACVPSEEDPCEPEEEGADEETDENEELEELEEGNGDALDG